MIVCLCRCVVVFRCSAVLLFCCSAVLLFCCSAVLLFCCSAVVSATVHVATNDCGLWCACGLLRLARAAWLVCYPRGVWFLAVLQRTT